MLVGVALMLMLLVLALPPLTAAACVLRLLQDVRPPCRLGELWFLHCLARPPLTAAALVP
jgi:hypothetical protein